MLIEKDFSFALQQIIYYELGIYCFSSCKVFEGDQGNVLFSLYGDKLKGIALIFRLKTQVDVCHVITPDEEAQPNCFQYTFIDLDDSPPGPMSDKDSSNCSSLPPIPRDGPRLEDLFEI